MFGSLKKIARSLRVPSVEEREMHYLNGSHDRIDLEYRQRQGDRGLFRTNCGFDRPAPCAGCMTGRQSAGLATPAGEH